MDLDKLRKILDSAHCGPWFSIYEEHHLCDLYTDCGFHVASDVWINDAKFIAQFNPQVVGAMLDVIESYTGPGADNCYCDPLNGCDVCDPCQKIRDRATNKLKDLLDV